MSAEDARFEDAGAAALRLRAMDAEDLTVLSALLQDAVLTAADMHHDPARRRFALLLNRFRWEDAPDAQRRHRPFERVRSLLVIDDVLKVAAQGIDRRDGDLVLSLLSVGFEPDRRWHRPGAADLCRRWHAGVLCGMPRRRSARRDPAASGAFGASAAPSRGGLSMQRLSTSDPRLRARLRAAARPGPGRRPRMCATRLPGSSPMSGRAATPP